MHQNSQNRQNLQQLGQGPVVGHTQEGVLSAVPPWARLVPAPVAVDQQAALPRTSVSGNGLPHTPVLVTLVVVMPAVVMSAVVVAVTPAYLAWGGVLVVLRGQAFDNSRRVVRAASSEAQWLPAYAH